MSRPKPEPAAHTEPSQKELLRRYGLKPKHSFGQNFLVDENLQQKISEIIAKQGRGAIEIGAGLGALTRPLLQQGCTVIAIERDRDLVPVLQRELAPAIASGQLTVLEADAKSVDYPELLKRLPAPRVLCGNLPYQLTGPLLRQVCQLSGHLAGAAFLVQAEVAERLQAKPGSADYGALSVFTQAAFVVQRALRIGPGAFFPQPKVDSALVTFTPRKVALAEETDGFVQLVHAAFQQRRKTLKNAWSGLFDLNAEQLRERAKKANIDLTARGETLSVSEFARMAEAVAT